MNVLPPYISACLFDLDGVLTRTTAVHAQAWKETFDAFLREHEARTGSSLAPFRESDYAGFVDGRQREDAVQAFLASRNIECDERATHDLAERKSARVRTLIREQGVEVYDDAVRFARLVGGIGLHTAVVSSSTSCGEVLRTADIVDVFDVVVDGVVAMREQLRGKPAPDAYVFAARALGVQPQDAAVFEDSASGVEAARRGGFGLVVGVDRVGRPDRLRKQGADIVVAQLMLLVGSLKTASSVSPY
jgi:beta-phosphoglucomutase family hydrolase